MAVSARSRSGPEDRFGRTGQGATAVRGVLPEGCRFCRVLADHLEILSQPQQSDHSLICGEAHEHFDQTRFCAYSSRSCDIQNEVADPLVKSSNVNPPDDSCEPVSTVRALP